MQRYGRLTAVGLAAAVVAACAPRLPAAGGESRTLVGVLSFIYGDPPPPSQDASIIVMLGSDDGRSWQVLPDSGSQLTVGELTRFDRARVVVVGRFMPGDTLVFRASRIDSLRTTAR